MASLAPTSPGALLLIQSSTSEICVFVDPDIYTKYLGNITTNNFTFWV